MAHLHESVGKGDIGEVKKILSKTSKYVNARDRYGITPLSSAVVWGNEEIVNELLTHCADPNIHDCLLKTPLHYACDLKQENATRIVQLLLDHNADVFAKDYKGQTPLTIALVNNHIEVIEVILWPSMERLFDRGSPYDLDVIRRYIKKNLKNNSYETHQK